MAITKSRDGGSESAPKTGHAFISWALSNGTNVKALAEYVGTSLAMIEQSYGSYTVGARLAPLTRALQPSGPAEGARDDSDGENWARTPVSLRRSHCHMPPRRRTGYYDTSPTLDGRNY